MDMYKKHGLYSITAHNLDEKFHNEEYAHIVSGFGTYNHRLHQQISKKGDEQKRHSKVTTGVRS